MVILMKGKLEGAQLAGASIRTSGVQALMQQAEEAFYQAKRSGRDQVVVWRIHDAERLDEAAAE
jgi:hypothetical protein